MIITNKYGIPEVFVNIAEDEQYDRGDSDISVSSLLSPPRIFQLKERHKDEITTDVMQEIWKLLGTALHALFEKYAPKNSLVEERLFININGWVVSGKFDIYDGGIDDYKYTSGWSLILGDRVKEWGQQLNIYKYLAEEHHLEVSRLRNILIIRDWTAYQAKQNEKFPQHEVHIVDQPIMPCHDVHALISSRVTAHQLVSDYLDDNLPICTPEERWAKKDVFAVMKKGRKSALKLFDTNNEAIEMVGNQPELYIEKRPGESVRCLSYCEVNQFCNFYKSLVKESE